MLFTFAGLEELNRHLVNIRLNLPVSPVHTINFDCDDCRMVFTDASDTLFIKNQRNACGTKDSQSTSHDGLTDKQVFFQLFDISVKQMRKSFCFFSHLITISYFL